MTYSYTQLAQYLRCPRSYRHRYLDGWREKGTLPGAANSHRDLQQLRAIIDRAIGSILPPVS